MNDGPMNAERLLSAYEKIADAPDAIARLRRFVLDLAVRGKLVPQDASDEPASELLKRIAAEKARLVKAGEIRKPKAIPALPEPPFPIPSNWRWSQLAEIGVLSPRNEAPDTLEASFVPMPLIAAEYGVANQHEIRPWGEIKKGYTHFAEGDVGLAKITPCFENGKSTVFRNLTGGIGTGTTELHIVRPLFVDQDYILLFLKSPHFIETGIPRMTGTAGQKRVPTEYFAHSPFSLPPLAEQHRIVAKVDELMALCDRLKTAREQRETARDRLAAASLARLNAPDPEPGADPAKVGTGFASGSATNEKFQADARFALDALPALTARPDQIKALRQTILNLAVRGKLVPQDANDEPASELLKRIAKEIAAYGKTNRIGQTGANPIPDDDLPFAAPNGWEWTRLCAVFKVITDGDHQPPPKADKGVAFLTIGNVTTGRLDFTGCRLVPEAYFKSLASYRTPAKGDILYTVVGATYGRPALVDTDRAFCVQRHIAILKPVEAMSVRFLMALLASPLIYDQATSSTTGTAQPTIALRPLRNFLAPLPPLAEQHRIVAKVDALMGLCDRLEAGLTATAATRRRLLEALLAEALAPADAREMEAAE
jgi:type I restriction enzyme S subunit